jgi:hypothetical protein
MYFPISIPLYGRVWVEKVFRIKHQETGYTHQQLSRGARRFLKRGESKKSLPFPELGFAVSVEESMKDGNGFARFT